METFKSLHTSCFFPQQYNTIVKPDIHWDETTVNDGQQTYCLT
jgi:hypothetical protein